jgi:hypothetical protein
MDVGAGIGGGCVFAPMCRRGARPSLKAHIQRASGAAGAPSEGEGNDATSTRIIGFTAVVPVVWSGECGS